MNKQIVKATICFLAGLMAVSQAGATEQTLSGIGDHLFRVSTIQRGAIR